ncbi:hypothetical protein CRG98_048894, partial [Punica granatum]
MASGHGARERERSQGTRAGKGTGHWSRSRGTITGLGHGARSP